MHAGYYPNSQEIVIVTGCIGLSASHLAQVAAKTGVVASSLVRDNGTRWAVVGRRRARLLAPPIECLINGSGGFKTLIMPALAQKA